MTFAQMVRDFFSVMRKAFVFKHYLVLGEKDVGRAFRYFLTLLAFSFVLVLLLLVPKAIDIASNAQTNALSIGQLRLDARLTTKGPVMLPSKSPFLTLDTTGNKSMQTERFLVTEKALHYNLWNENKSVEFATYDFANSRDRSVAVALILFLVLLPGILVGYYLAYLAKYLLIIVPLCILSFLLARTFKSQITLAQTLMLAFYAATPMVLLEILTAPFALKYYIFSYVPFMGVQFSAIAFGLFFVYFVTAIRINGNRYVQRI
ncbi:DUF1189 family protein [Candidatus Woesearchaeota archaeon]|nr:DUF1189 family protein [Candidatus Woesearchaeota archaeon]